MNERINFNPSTLNIFTDASVRNMNYGFDSASGLWWNLCHTDGSTISFWRKKINVRTA